MGMRGRQWWDELICILCLGIGTTCVMTGYDTQSFIVESVLHSVHLRQPTAIDGHAGYYGQAVLYAVYALATLFAPWVCLRIGAKWSLFSGSLLFTAYQVGFFYLNSYYFYLTQALMGIGFARAAITLPELLGIGPPGGLVHRHIQQAENEQAQIRALKDTGLSNRDIALQLGRSHGFVARYLRNPDCYLSAPSLGRPRLLSSQDHRRIGRMVSNST
ncbi:unnamed protein product [Nippostrongylus brasiliensis]|uniref:UNC93-like protein MFSD11 (inferred by orthology to a human protein) n=1 Tax=Nippostrongylus brasiliensis TaxID=27835 RepID=A0A0N4YFA7_NIPBR|nr:unnamed protein product [Nippostrongylus brasiliensis]